MVCQGNEYHKDAGAYRRVGGSHPNCFGREGIHMRNTQPGKRLAVLRGGQETLLRAGLGSNARNRFVLLSSRWPLADSGGVLICKCELRGHDQLTGQRLLVLTGRALAQAERGVAWVVVAASRVRSEVVHDTFRKKKCLQQASLLLNIARLQRKTKKRLVKPMKVQATI